MVDEMRTSICDDDSFLHFVAVRIEELNSCLEDWTGCDLFFDEKNKGATMIFNPLDPIFVLGPWETDAGKLTATIKGIERSRKKLIDARFSLLNLPEPANRLVERSVNEVTKQLEQINAALRYFQNVKLVNPERANVRAVNIAKALRAIFEHYTRLGLTATKTDGVLTSHFCLALEAVFEVVGMQNDPFEPARLALRATSSDSVLREYKRLLNQPFNPQTDFPYYFCKHCFEYVETNEHNCGNLNDSEEIQCLEGPTNAYIRR